MNVIRFIVVLGLSRLSVANLLEFARLIKNSISVSTYFTTPEPPLADLTTAINKLSNEHSAPASPGKAARVKQYAIALRQMLTEEGAYVESVANADPENAVSIIESASMRVKHERRASPNGFRLKITGIPGEIQLRTNSEARSAFLFQFTTTADLPGSWVDLYFGTRAGYKATGLVSGAKHYFRVMKIDKNGKSPWSNVLSIMVP